MGLECRTFDSSLNLPAILSPLLSGRADAGRERKEDSSYKNLPGIRFSLGSDLPTWPVAVLERSQLKEARLSLADGSGHLGARTTRGPSGQEGLGGDLVTDSMSPSTGLGWALWDALFLFFSLLWVPIWS